MAFPPLNAIYFVTNTPEISSLNNDCGQKNFSSRPGRIAWEGFLYSDKYDGLITRTQKVVPQEREH